jgi:hypothetical protein
MARTIIACIALLGLLSALSCGTSKVNVGAAAGTGEISEVEAGDISDGRANLDLLGRFEVVENVSPDLPDICQPDCQGNECGDDGCGGSCGECIEGEECLADWIVESAVCTDTCETLCELGNNECGEIYPAGPHEDSGCNCGACSEDEPYCTASNKCSPHPQDEGTFGWPCTNNQECLSGFCVDDAHNKVCSITCVEECPTDFACVQCTFCLPDIDFICLPKHARICKPCTTDSDCEDVLGDVGSRCVGLIPAGKFCGSNCSSSAPCPVGYECHEVATADGGTAEVCIPAEGLDVCDCSPLAIVEEAENMCYIQNFYGKCLGQRSCGPDGLTACDADTPLVEVCDGKDNNCDGEADEGCQ